MRATTSGLSLTLALLASACAGAEMNRTSGDGDDVGESANDETAGDDDDDSDPSDPSTTSDAPTTDDPSTTDPATTDPTDPTDPLDGSTTDPSASETDPTAEDSTGSDPSTSESSDTDPTDAESSSDDGAVEESTTTDATESDTQSSDEIDLSGWTLVQTASAREIVIPDGTLVPVGGFLVIGRNASAATFQDFWSVAWGDDVVYVEGGDDFPTINGDETYTLRDPNDVVVDGPTPALALSTSAARVDAAMAGTAEAAWESSATPNTSAVPGESVATGGASGVPYISEYADTTGQGNFGYEFVEVHVPL